MISQKNFLKCHSIWSLSRYEILIQKGNTGNYNTIAIQHRKIRKL